MAPKIYLAGPEVFLADALAIGARKKQLCQAFGFEGLFPLDKEIEPDTASGVALDRLIYRQNVAMIRKADVGIFNLTPFRGVGADPGTVFELGMFAGLGKPVYGYTNDARDMLVRVRDAGLCTSADNVARDDDGMLVEDFGGADNLMITCSLLDGGFSLVRHDVRREEMFYDLAGFVACLEAARAG